MKNCFSHLCCFTRQKESDTQLDDMALGADMRSETQNGHRNAEHCRKSPSCVSFFSEDEKNHLALAARKAKGLSNVIPQDFDSNEEAQARTISEGQLYKYTNVVKGYQYRFFVLNREMGTLEYYMLEDVKKTRPRGAMHLAGAVVSPSDEDGQMFTVSAACGEVYKLRAQDSKERQLWVNRMRFVAEAHTDSIGLKHPPIYPALPAASKEKENKPQPLGVLPCPGEAFQSLQQRLSEANLAFRDLAVAMETLPNTMQIKPHDPDLLLLKATSTATVVCLEQCFSLLSDQRYEQRLHNTPSHGRKHHSKKLKKKVRDWAHQPFRPVFRMLATGSRKFRSFKIPP